MSFDQGSNREVPTAVVKSDLQYWGLIAAELQLLATAGNLQLVLHNADLHTKKIRIVNTAKLEETLATLAFEDEAVDNQLYQLQATRGGYPEDTWRIKPSQLKCKTKLNGDLYTLGEGRFGSVSFL